MYHIVVVDSHVVRVYRTRGPGRLFEQVREFANPDMSRHERDLVSARPGRVLNRAAGIHQALTASSERRRRTEAWLKSVGRTVVTPLMTADSDGLLLVAAPRATESVLAGTRGKPVKERMATHRCNLAGQPIAALQRRLQVALQALARQHAKVAMADREMSGLRAQPTSHTSR